MDCPHCGRAFHDHWKTDLVVRYSVDEPYNATRIWEFEVAICPACKGVIIELEEKEIKSQMEGWLTKQRFRAYPRNSFRKPVSKEVPRDIANDYEEACAVISISEKASAALSRRCLQTVLRDQGYMQHNLVQQIDALLNEKDPLKAIPSGLRQTIDLVRNFGNFSAHPITDQTTLQVIDVEPQEAESCLEILDEVFDHFYVKPALAAARKAALDAKLVAAGKPPSK